MPSMRMLRAVEYPAYRTAGRWVFDVLVTLLAAASAVPAALHDQARPRAGTVVVLALAAAPLLVRRIWPVPVLGCVLAVDIRAGLWREVHAINGLALLIALSTGASMRPRRDRPRDARHRRAPPHRHDHPERRGDRHVGHFAGAGHRGHAQGVSDWTARAGRYAQAPRRAAPAPRPGRRRGSSAGTRHGPARRAHRAGPVGGARYQAGDPRRRAGRSSRCTAHGVPAGA